MSVITRGTLLTSFLRPSIATARTAQILGLPRAVCPHGLQALPRFKSSKGYYNRMPEIEESDIEETFVRGSGPGGQSINKTNISVSLVHKPTGIRVRCHETRSREQNRLMARRILRERIDMALNPGTSQRDQKGKAVAAKKSAKKRKHQRKKREKDEEAQEEEGEEGGHEEAEEVTEAARKEPPTAHEK